MSFREDFIRGQSAVALSAILLEAGGTDQNITEVDFGEVRDAGHSISLSAKLVTNGTAPGTTKTVTVQQYWSDEKITPANAPTELLARKVAGTALAVPNSANATRYFEIQAEVNPKARFLYLSTDWTALAAGAEIAATVRVNRID
jgi:hypothetical protein